MEAYRRVDGVVVEPVGRLWAAFSPATGETTLLNDESASILEVLGSEAMGTTEICVCLAADSGLPSGSIAEVVRASWPRLIEAGLVRSQCSSDGIHR